MAYEMCDPLLKHWYCTDNTIGVHNFSDKNYRWRLHLLWPWRSYNYANNSVSLNRARGPVQLTWNHTRYGILVLLSVFCSSEQITLQIHRKWTCCCAGMTFDMSQLFAKNFSKNPIFSQNFAPGKFQFEILFYFHSHFNELYVCSFLIFAGL